MALLLVREGRSAMPQQQQPVDAHVYVADWIDRRADAWQDGCKVLAQCALSAGNPVEIARAQLEWTARNCFRFAEDLAAGRALAQDALDHAVGWWPSSRSTAASRAAATTRAAHQPLRDTAYGSQASD